MTSSPFGISVDPVPARRLGTTTVRVGEIGFGCMGLTGVYNVEARDDKRSEAAVHRALDLGMSYLDTSDSFGPFGNERFLGQALIRRRQDAVLATKVGVTGRADGTYHLNGSPDHIRWSVDESLRRLRANELDVYILQAVDPAVPVEETWGAMAGLVAAGKVRTLGVRTTDTRLLGVLQQVFPISVVTAELSYWEQGNLPLVGWTAERGMAFVASSPLGRGFLTGSISPSRTFKWTDLRSKHPEVQAGGVAPRGRRPGSLAGGGPCPRRASRAGRTLVVAVAWAERHAHPGQHRSEPRGPERRRSTPGFDARGSGRARWTNSHDRPEAGAGQPT